MSTHVIELDTTVPWKPPSPPPRHWGPPRWLVAALMVMLLFVTPLNATRSERSYVPLLISATRDAMLFVGGDTAYELPVFPTQEPPVRAYGLPSGRLRWEKAVREVGGSYWQVHGDMLFQTVDRPGQVGRMSSSVLRAVDPATGNVRWERNGVQAILANSKVVVLVESVFEEAPGRPPEFGSWRPVAVHAVDPMTGREVWSRPQTGAFAFSWRSVDWADRLGFNRLRLAGRPPVDALALAELSPTAELRMTNLSTGVTSPPVQLALTSAPEYFEIVDGVLSFRTGGDLIAYDLAANQLLSRLAVPNGTYPCGRAYLCNGSVVLDRRSGATLLELPNSQVAGAMGDRLLFRSAELIVRTTTVVDLAGDRVPRSFASWGSPVQFDDHRVIATGHTLKSGAMTVAVLDVDTGRAVVVGHARNLFVPPDCRRSGDYIVCNSQPYHLVWRLPAELRSHRERRAARPSAGPATRRCPQWSLVLPTQHQASAQARQAGGMSIQARTASCASGVAGSSDVSSTSCTPSAP